MKRLLTSMLLAAGIAAGWAQTKTMTISRTNGNKIVIPLAEIADISVSDVSREQGVLAMYSLFAGSWYLVASPYDGGVSSIPLTVTIPAADSEDYGHCLYAHTGALLTDKQGKAYPADLKLPFSYDEQSKTGTIGLLLDTSAPISAEEYSAQPQDYAMHFQASTSGRHLLFLATEDLEKQQLTTQKTLWSEWTENNAANHMDDHAFTLPKEYAVYVLVGMESPCRTLVGYADILASPRLQRTPYAPAAGE